MLIDLIRHGETIWQREKRYQGKSDVPLSPEGQKRLHAASYQPPFVYVTPLLRTRQTARILFPDSEQIVIPGLQEMDFGSFEGRTADEMESDPDYRTWVEGKGLGRCPGGECYEEFSNRVCHTFEFLLKESPDQNLVIVAHGGTQMAILERYGYPHRNYWEWMTGCGKGYRLKGDGWPQVLQLQVAQDLDFTRKKEMNV